MSAQRSNFLLHLYSRTYQNGYLQNIRIISMLLYDEEVIPVHLKAQSMSP